MLALVQPKVLLLIPLAFEICSVHWPRICYADQGGPELGVVLLPLPFECWDYTLDSAGLA